MLRHHQHKYLISLGLTLLIVGVMLEPIKVVGIGPAFYNQAPVDSIVLVALSFFSFSALYFGRFVVALTLLTALLCLGEIIFLVLNFSNFDGIVFTYGPTIPLFVFSIGFLVLGTFVYIKTTGRNKEYTTLIRSPFRTENIEKYTISLLNFVKANWVRIAVFGILAVLCFALIRSLSRDVYSVDRAQKYLSQTVSYAESIEICSNLVKSNYFPSGTKLSSTTIEKLYDSQWAIMYFSNDMDIRVNCYVVPSNDKSVDVIITK